MRHSTYLKAILSVSASIAAASPSAQQWAERSIYQVMTDRFARPAGSSNEPCEPYKYCGGSWVGIIDKLDYIQDLGFTAVQISPVVENIPEDTTYGEAYHGRWPQNLYALNDHFGTADELRKLAKELHKRGMYFMVDVTINNMAQAFNHSVSENEQPDLDWSRLTPFDEEQYYHPYCKVADSNDPESVEKCWRDLEVVALPDLNTENDKVASMIQEWAKGLVGNYSIDGLRVDSARNMNDAYLTSFSRAAGVFTMGEVDTESTGDACKYEDFMSGILNQPLHEPMVQAFTAGDMQGLAEEVRSQHSKCRDFTRLATYTESQDLPRFAALTNDTNLAKNAMAFNILSDGIPIVYQGQEQHLQGPEAPYNREPLWKTDYNSRNPLYNTTRTLNKLRNHAIRLDKHHAANHSKELYVDGSTYATRKGAEGSQIVSVFSNLGAKGGRYNLSLPGAFAPGTEAVDVLSCETVTADDEGNVTVEMNAGKPKAFFPAKKMNGSGLCGYQRRKNALTPAVTTPNITPTVTNDQTVGEDTPDDYVSSASDSTVSYIMVLLCAFSGVANWLL
ncbi:hypothetical protein ASPVEDRAFT_52555 [Aspergillus versicolor CBS 583.65]|uniref:alpha-amylase n=1 Tax=Aspergillus versicolor CBS 583.65 TaxID=1036611 RepID=A0A1L9PJM9_ASPVE|nr:uncharacterized protein ASPVEDRAFT_52555 [Aspergillus versicolor CBS 583.65]OJJ01645.1 hypothetical protein ASPVEDRAFT_52555 [Aspergillus versicolor CBS 583.65]